MRQKCIILGILGVAHASLLIRIVSYCRVVRLRVHYVFPVSWIMMQAQREEKCKNNSTAAEKEMLRRLRTRKSCFACPLPTTIDDTIALQWQRLLLLPHFNGGGLTMQ
jgi:hypothetical protein